MKKTVKATKLLLLLILLFQLQDGFSQCSWFVSPAGTHNICTGESVSKGCAWNGSSADIYVIAPGDDTLFRGTNSLTFSLSPTVSTIYECHAVVTTGCTGTYIATIGINVTVCTGTLDQMENTGITVSRNGSEYILLTSGNFGEATITNIQGSIVKQFVFTTDKSEYALTNLRMGVYVVSINYNGRQKIFKLAVE